MPTLPEAVTEIIETPADVHTGNGAGEVNTAAPAKVRKKAAKKAAVKSGKPVAVKAKPKAKKAPVKRAPKVEEKPLAQTIDKGGTRQRTFAALKRYPTGLSQKQIKQRCGMAEVSGHLAVILGEEIEAGRIKRDEVETPSGGTSYIYKLTAAGSKALEKDELGGRETSGHFGVAWSKDRLAAEKKPAKKSKKNK